MGTETTEKRKPRKEGLFFSTTGEAMTNTIRDSWVSDMPKHALAICKTLSMNTEQALEVITGKKKLTGDTRYDDGLDWADDNTTEVCGIKLDVQTMIDRLEAKYIDASEAINLFNNGAENIIDKLRYVDADSDFLNDDLKYNDGNIDYYKKRVSDAIEQLEAVYPLVGKSMKDLPLNKVRSAARLIKAARTQQMADDFESNKGNDIEQKFDKVIRISQEAILDKLDKEEEEEEEKKDINSRFYTGVGGGASYFISHCDVKKCKEEGLHAGWLLPDGTFFGGDGIWIHRGIIDELFEFDYFKDKNFRADEDSVQDEGNWIKYSGNDWMIWEHKHKLTKEQIEFIIEYTTDVRKSTFITVNSHYEIHISVFAKLLDGITQFNDYKMREESEPIIKAEREAEKNKKNNPLSNFPTVEEVSAIDVLSTPFFQPDVDFVKWIIEYAGDRLIIDCGAGSGYTTALINHLGGKCIAIEPHYTEERNIFWRSKGFQFHVFFKKSEEEAIIRDIPDGKALLIFARPCHSGFVYNTIKNNMPKGMEALYISHKDNVKFDLHDIKYTELKHEGTSKSNEFVLSIKK